MSAALVYTKAYTSMECGECGVSFALTDDFIARRRADHRDFYCPNGHNRYWPQESELERERRLRKQAEARSTHYSDQMEAEKRSAAAVRGHLTRLRKRIAAGVCPWCQRTVKQMADHVQDKHPEHVEQYEAAK